MNDYLHELGEYLKHTPELKQTPSGIYSITHGPTILALFRAMHRLHSHKFKKDRATSLAEKAALSSEIKTAITSIRSEFLGAPGPTANGPDWTGGDFR